MGHIHLTTMDGDPALGDEGYELIVTEDKITLCACQPAGLFRGIQTLRQLLPPGAVRASVQPGACEIAAGGFRDFTRIASSDPTMWRDIALTNQDALVEMMQQFETFFAELKQDVASGSSEKLFEFFRRSKQSRDEIL